MQGLGGGRAAVQNTEDQERCYKRRRGEAEKNVCKDAWYKRAKRGEIHPWGCQRCRTESESLAVGVQNQLLCTSKREVKGTEVLAVKKKKSRVAKIFI